MKIGILTFHCAHNYGAVLQAYALVTFLRHNGYDAEIIDYRPTSIIESHGTFPKARIKKAKSAKGFISVLRMLLWSVPRYKRSCIFNEFIESLPLSKPRLDQQTKLLNYDYIFCGSDQIWNPKITNGIDPLYSAQIKSTGSYISYAASMELGGLDKIRQKEIKNYIFNFKEVSVRENSLKKAIEKFVIDKKITQVLDPVFLLPLETWTDFAKTFITRCRYVLVYQVRRDKRVVKFAEKYAKFHNLRVVEITSEAEYSVHKWQYGQLSPQQFVGLFSGAEAVVTTSFHGTAFSVIFGKPFKTILFNAPGDGRAIDLLESLGDTESLLNIEDCDKCNLNNWNVPHYTNIDTLRKQSTQFIENALSKDR